MGMPQNDTQSVISPNDMLSPWERRRFATATGRDVEPPCRIITRQWAIATQDAIGSFHTREVDNETTRDELNVSYWEQLTTHSCLQLC